MNAEFNLLSIKEIARQLWQQSSAYKVWTFNAPMGAGKTTFIHALCEILGVEETISSPTFAIVNEYKSSVAGTIFHMDWYRIKNEEEAFQAGIQDLLDSGNLCLIEWPEKADAILQENALKIFIEVINETTRRLYTV